MDEIDYGFEYYIVRPDPNDSSQIELLGFRNRYEVRSYLNGCSNPRDCLVLRNCPLVFDIVEK